MKIRMKLTGEVREMPDDAFDARMDLHLARAGLAEFLVDAPPDGVVVAFDDDGTAYFHDVAEMNQALFREWLGTRPAVLIPTLRRFPYGARVRSAPGERHVCPQGVGIIATWQENGGVSVVELGNPVRGFCAPDTLDVIDRGPLADVWDAWIDEAALRRP